MIIDVLPYDEITRDTNAHWSYGLYVWKTDRHKFDTRSETAKNEARLFQLDWKFLADDVVGLSDIVDKYRAMILNKPEAFGPGKYNVRLVVNEDQLISITMKVT